MITPFSVDSINNCIYLYMGTETSTICAVVFFFFFFCLLCWFVCWLIYAAACFLFITLRTSEAVAQCIVIAPVCLCVCLWVCYHDNSKLRASIVTKLGLQVKVVTISSWLNLGRPAPPGKGSAAGRNFWFCLTTASAQCLRLLRALFHYLSVMSVFPLCKTVSVKHEWPVR